MKFINDHIGAIAIVLTIALVMVAYFTVKNTQALQARATAVPTTSVPSVSPTAPVAPATAEEK